MVKFFITFFILSSKILAADCGGLNEGEVLRLDQAGKSLANFKVFDQDGLGICASTATSLLLQSVLPDNPRLSYMQLATVNHRTNLDQQRKDMTATQNKDFKLYAKKKTGGEVAVNPNQAVDDGWEVAIEGASVCSVIEAAKSFQKLSLTEGICLSDRVNLEKFSGGDDTGWKQRKSVLAVSKYMNEFQQRFGEAQVEKTYGSGKKSGLAAFFEEKKDSKAEVAHNQKVREQYLAFKTAFDEQLNRKRTFIADDCRVVNSDLMAAPVKEMVHPLIGHTYCEEGSRDKDLMCILRKNIMAIQQLPGEAKKPILNVDFLKSLANSLPAKSQPLSVEEFRKHMKTTIQKISTKKFTDYEHKYIDEAITQISPKTIEEALKEINQIKTKGHSPVCAERKLMDYLVSEEFKKDASQNLVLCQSMGLLENVQEVITMTAKSGLVAAGKVRDFLLADANLNFDEAMRELYAQDCSANDKVKIPETLTCNEFSVDKTKPDVTRKKIIDEIKNNRALTGTVCASIFKKPKSQFTEGECGSHAVGITGVRCMNGKTSYLIQNSWGVSNKSINPAIINDEPSIGAYWVDEQSFNDGFSALQSIGRR